MKKLLVLIFLVMASKSFAAAHELYFYIHDGTNCVPMLIEVYHNGSLYSSGYTLDHTYYNEYGSANGAGEIYPHTNFVTFAAIPQGGGTWFFYFGLCNFSINLDGYKGGDLYIDYDVVTHSCTITPKTTDYPSYSGPSFLGDKSEIILTNDFATTSSGSGNFIYDGSTVSNPSYKRAFIYSTDAQYAVPHWLDRKRP